MPLALEQIQPFHNYFEQFGLRNFQSFEILIGTGRELNHIPPEDIWDNIIPTVLILDELRDHFNAPIVISSGYRSEAYNDGISGASDKSQHQAFTALDFHVRSSDVTTSDVVDVLKEWRDNEKIFLLPRPITRKPVQVQEGTVPFTPLTKDDTVAEDHFIFKGGIGLYNTFVHLDTRGDNRSWNG